MATPAVAIERCRNVTVDMAEESISSVKSAMEFVLNGYDAKVAEKIKESEKTVDKYELSR